MYKIIEIHAVEGNLQYVHSSIGMVLQTAAVTAR